MSDKKFALDRLRHAEAYLKFREFIQSHVNTRHEISSLSYQELRTAYDAIDRKFRTVALNVAYYDIFDDIHDGNGISEKHSVRICALCKEYASQCLVNAYLAAPLVVVA